jgi:hypothetical protein
VVLAPGDRSPESPDLENDECDDEADDRVADQPAETMTVLPITPSET